MIDPDEIRDDLRKFMDESIEWWTEFAEGRLASAVRLTAAGEDFLPSVRMLDLAKSQIDSAAKAIEHLEGLKSRRRNLG